MALTVVRGLINSLEIDDVVVDPWLYRDHGNPTKVEKEQKIMRILTIIAAATGQIGATAAASRGASGHYISALSVKFKINDRLFSGIFDGSCSNYNTFDEDSSRYDIVDKNHSDFPDFPFCESDEVEVVVQGGLDATPCEALAVARPADRFVVMPRLCSRGRKAYLRRATRRWLVVSIIAGIVAVWVSWTGAGFPFDKIMIISCIVLAFAAFYAGIEYRSYVENYKPYVYLTEKILSALGVKDTENVDLVLNSKKTKNGTETRSYGNTYFRY